jgi:hypothetical protein
MSATSFGVTLYPSFANFNLFLKGIVIFLALASSLFSLLSSFSLCPTAFLLAAPSPRTSSGEALVASDYRTSSFLYVFSAHFFFFLLS